MGIFGDKELFTSTKAVLVIFGLTIFSCAPEQHIGKNLTSESGIRWGTTATKEDVVSNSTVAVIGGDMEMVCSGTLIAQNIVLTAAHCIVEDMDMKVVFSPKATDEKATRPVTGVSVHPLYKNELSDQYGNTNLDKADIAVVYYSGSTPEGYVPAKILANMDKLKRDAYVTVAGYGIADDFPAIQGSRHVPSDLVGYGTGLLRFAKVMIDNPHFSSTEASVDQSWGKGICQGDSGGPAYMVINDKLFLWGVASWGSMRAKKSSCANMAVFTKVLPHLNFINKSAQFLIKKARLAQK